MSDVADHSGLSDLRREYRQNALREGEVDADPMVQFSRWFAEARGANLVEPNAMTLATVDEAGRPTARVVLLKAFDAAGFVFFTNLHSGKAQHIARQPEVALCFYWDQLERSVRVTGSAGPVTRAEAQAYFRSRPHGSKIGAIASNQSRVVESRAVLEARFAQLLAQFPEDGTVEVPCPPHWGGFRVAPRSLEFWQGQPSRLHDRLRYTRTGPDEEAAWIIERLAP
jgi:pyridoxamine 5'-phosphate oxidase